MNGGGKSLREVLGTLREKELLSQELFENALIWLREKKEAEDDPIYLKVLVGAGAWVSALFLTAAIAGIVSVGSGSMGILFFFGIVAIAAAIAVSKASKLLFVEQSALALALAGHLLVFAGMMDIVDENILFVAFVYTIIAGAGCALYDNGVYRFLAPLSALSLLFAGFEEEKLYHVNTVLAVAAAYSSVVMFGLLPAVSKLRPLAFSLATTALLIPLYTVWSEAADETKRLQLYTMNVFFGIGLCGLYAYFAGGVAKLKSEWGVVAVAGALLIAVVGTPGILAAVGALIVAYGLRNPAFLAVAFAALGWYVFFHYYDMSMSLLHKSFLLAGTGAFMLAIRFVLRRRPWAKEAAR